MLPACRHDGHGRVRCAAAESVKTVGIHAPNCGVPVYSDFPAPLERVVTLDVSHVILNLKQITERTSDGPIGGVIRLIEAVAKRDRRLSMVAGRKEGRAASIADGSNRGEMG